MRSSVSAREISPRPCVAMKFIASGVALSAGTKRSPSFSRSLLSTSITILPFRTSGRICSIRYSLVRGAFIALSISAVGGTRYEPHELGSRLVGVELACKGRRGRDRVLLLNPAHHHTEMLR